MTQAPDWKPGNNTNLTVGGLKEILYRLGPEFKDMPVFVERIHDHYFENNNWTTLKIGDYDYPEDDFKFEFIESWCCTINKEKMPY